MAAVITSNSRTSLGLLGQIDSASLLKDLSSYRSITFDMRETAAWKSANNDSFFEMDDLTNYIFGKVQDKTVKAT